MSNTRNLSNLLDSNGDVKATHLDNAPTPTKSEIEGLGIAASSLTGALPAISGANLTGILTAVTLDSPSISGTLSVDSGSNVTHTIGNWSEELNYTITPTNCTVGSINASGEFIVTHTSGVPSYTIKATTDNLGLDDSSLVTKNMVVKLTAPTISSPADTPVTTNVVYTVTSTDSGDDKIILDMGTSNFTYQSVDVGSGSKVGNTVEVTGFTTGNPAITVQFTALGTYASVKAKSTNIAGTYGDSNYSSSDSIVCYEQLSAPSLNAPADSDDATAVTYTISSIDSNATKVIFDAQSSNFTYGSVGSGSGSKVGNTVEITGWSGTSVTVTLTYTTAATYTNRAKVTNTADATYTDSAYSSADSIVISSSAIAATGGTIVTSGGYKYHTFTSSGTFTVTASGSSGSVDILVVAGGGAGGGMSSGGSYHGSGGGAGAGGMQSTTTSVTATSYSITVGAGGAGSSGGTGGNGTNSSGLGLTSIGGGHGARGNSGVAAASGGSGGGASREAQTPANGTSGQGNAGGAFNPGASGSGSNASGGGGKGAVGGPYNGGAGASWNGVTYAGGGGGGQGGNTPSNNGSSGGSGGGGIGGRLNFGAGGNGSANLGGGGGGGGAGNSSGGTSAGGNGGSGIVVIRYAV
jgi:hypothetical protein